MHFPLYRKYSHNRTFFKINSLRDFEELNIIGTFYTLRFFEVKLFTDRVLIEDMIANENNLWVEISEEEYSERKDFCLKNLKLLS